MLNIKNVNPADLIDNDEIAAANERHRLVEQRLTVAEGRLVQLEAAHTQARKAHTKALAGDEGDPSVTKRALQDAADAEDLVRESLVHIKEAIRKSAAQLKRETDAASSEALNAAIQQAVAAAKNLDNLRKVIVPEAIRNYRAACVMVNQLSGDPAKLSTANFLLKPVEDWTAIDDVRGNVAPFVASVCGVDLIEEMK